MRQDRVTGVTGPGGPGSGYLIAPGLVLTSAHVVGQHGAAVEVFRPGRPGTVAGRVVWCGTPGGRDDAALVELDDPGWAEVRDTVRWGRTVTERPGLRCECWGVPEVVQRADRATELLQVSGGLNPGSYAVGDRYLLDVDAGPDARTDGSSPWGGMCGAALFSEDLLIGVVAADPGEWGHRALEAVPAYVLHHDPAFREVLCRHGEALLGLDPVELRAVTDEQARSPLSETVPTPAGLLPARRAVVPFHGREDQLTDLHTWAQAPGVGVWLLHGPGGQGKTRLAHQFGHQLAAQGWAVVWLHPDAAGAQLDVLAEVVRPLLIVVDYAETRPEQLQTLLTVVATRQTATPAKVLLLARTAGSWWDQVAANGTDPVRDLVETARVAELTVLDHTPDGQQQAYQAAVQAFGATLPRVPGLGTIGWTAITEHTRHRPLPAGFGVQTALAVQMTALADLLDVAQPGGTTDGDRRRGPEDRVLDHERGYWASTARAQSLTPGLSMPTLTDAVAVTVLLGAPVRDDADELLKQVRGLADQPVDCRERVRAWLAGLYPVDPGHGLAFESLQPDRLAERLIGRLALDTSRTSIVETVAGQVNGEQAARWVTVCARAATHAVFADQLSRALTRWCVRYPTTLAVAALQVATQVETPGPLLRAAEQIAADTGVDTAVLTRLVDELPEHSHVLAEGAAALTQALVARHRQTLATNPDTDPADLALSLNNLSVWLGDLGRREQALEAITEAVSAYRELAAARPAVHQAELDRSLEVLRWLEGLA